jgi:hypothetical protein
MGSSPRPIRPILAPSLAAGLRPGNAYQVRSAVNGGKVQETGEKLAQAPELWLIMRHCRTDSLSLRGVGESPPSSRVTG